jgi:hypothetical protein
VKPAVGVNPDVARKVPDAAKGSDAAILSDSVAAFEPANGELTWKASLWLASCAWEAEKRPLIVKTPVLLYAADISNGPVGLNGCEPLWFALSDITTLSHGICDRENTSLPVITID